MYVFKQLQYEYSGMSGKPTGFKYDHLKDLLKWNNLPPKHYTQLITTMFYSFLKHLKSD